MTGMPRALKELLLKRFGVHEWEEVEMMERATNGHTEKTVAQRAVALRLPWRALL
jgi:hypothetical protein